MFFFFFGCTFQYFFYSVLQLHFKNAMNLVCMNVVCLLITTILLEKKQKKLKIIRLKRRQNLCVAVVHVVGCCCYCRLLLLTTNIKAIRSSQTTSTTFHVVFVNNHKAPVSKFELCCLFLYIIFTLMMIEINLGHTCIYYGFVFFFLYGKTRTFIRKKQEEI